MLPDKYKWLEEIGTLPKLVSAALQYLGVKEYPGVANNPVIMNMAKELGIDDIYTNDSVQAWCAVFMFYMLKITGKPFPPVHDKYGYLRAVTFINYGSPVVRGEEKLGDIIVLKRPQGHHVFILIAFNKKTGNPIGIGGNQSNMVCFTEFDKNRIVASRRFYATQPPESAKQYFVDAAGELSTNEA